MEDTTQALADLAPQAIDAVRSYFTSTDDTAAKKADMGLKVLRTKNGADSNRIKVLALQFQIARAVGLKGEPLRPLLQELNPAFANETAPAIAAPAETKR
jgi:hypothetical protein